MKKLTLFNDDGYPINLQKSLDDNNEEYFLGELHFENNSSDTYKTLNLMLMEEVNGFEIQNLNLSLTKSSYYNLNDISYIPTKTLNGIKLDNITISNEAIDNDFYTKWLWGKDIQVAFPKGTMVYIKGLIENYPISLHQFTSINQNDIPTFLVIETKSNAILIKTRINNKYCLEKMWGNLSKVNPNGNKFKAPNKNLPQSDKDLEKDENCVIKNPEQLFLLNNDPFKQIGWYDFTNAYIFGNDVIKYTPEPNFYQQLKNRVKAKWVSIKLFGNPNIGDKIIFKINDKEYLYQITSNNFDIFCIRDKEINISNNSITEINQIPNSFINWNDFIFYNYNRKIRRKLLSHDDINKLKNEIKCENNLKLEINWNEINKKSSLFDFKILECELNSYKIEIDSHYSFDFINENNITTKLSKNIKYSNFYIDICPIKEIYAVNNKLKPSIFNIDIFDHCLFDIKEKEFNNIICNIDLNVLCDINITLKDLPTINGCNIILESCDLLSIQSKEIPNCPIQSFDLYLTEFININSVNNEIIKLNCNLELNHVELYNIEQTNIIINDKICSININELNLFEINDLFVQTNKSYCKINLDNCNFINLNSLDKEEININCNLELNYINTINIYNDKIVDNKLITNINISNLNFIDVFDNNNNQNEIIYKINFDYCDFINIFNYEINGTINKCNIELNSFDLWNESYNIIESKNIKCNLLLNNNEFIQIQNLINYKNTIECNINLEELNLYSISKLNINNNPIDCTFDINTINLCNINEIPLTKQITIDCSFNIKSIDLYNLDFININNNIKNTTIKLNYLEIYDINHIILDNLIYYNLPELNICKTFEPQFLTVPNNEIKIINCNLQTSIINYNIDVDINNYLIIENCNFNLNELKLNIELNTINNNSSNNICNFNLIENDISLEINNKKLIINDYKCIFDINNYEINLNIIENNILNDAIKCNFKINEIINSIIIDNNIKDISIKNNKFKLNILELNLELSNYFNSKLNKNINITLDFMDNNFITNIIKLNNIENNIICDISVDIKYVNLNINIEEINL